MASSPIPSSSKKPPPPPSAEEGSAYGCSASSSSSSIYHHPFSSFNFDAFHEAAVASDKERDDNGHTSSRDEQRLSARFGGLSISPKDHHHHVQHRPGSSREESSSPNVPPSPATSYAESTHSMEEYEMDSPSSLSSWNSFMSGHRGDLADVEDLELGEPELETVSEVDEDAGNNTSSLPPRFGQESEDDEKRHDHRQQSHNFGDSLARRRTVTQHSQAPTLSHFSPRTGGHGLSHHSRWTSRTPASLAARRRKGRIAELAEEGGGTEAHGIHSTNLGAAVAANDRSNSSSGSSSPTSLLAPQQSQRCEHPYPGTPPSTQWSDFTGPPAPPIRPISPSETVPAVPSPLCECISAEAQAAADQVTPTSSVIKSQSHMADQTQPQPQPASPLPAPLPRRGVFDSVTQQDLTRSNESTSPPSPSSTHTGRTTASSSATDGVPAPSSPDTTPPTSPVQELKRKTSPGGRARRASSPPRPHHTKVPLRPCFSRRNSTQTGSSSASEQDGGSPRGRCHVRFSPAPPQTIRTHSPVDYDRSSCPINNRLSLKDVEELQGLEMDMGLLSAKCSAIAAITSCKLPGGGNKNSISEPASPAEPTDAVRTASTTSPSTSAHTSIYDTDGSGRPRRDSTGGFVHHIGGGIAGKSQNAGRAMASCSSSSPKSGAGGDGSQVSPADFLRAQREKERERACRMAGIGTGLGGRNLGRGVRGQATNPLIARFGLTAPPPPLPGCPRSAAAAATSSFSGGEAPMPSSSSSSALPTKAWFAEMEERRGRQAADDGYATPPSSSRPDSQLSDHDRTLSPPVQRRAAGRGGGSAAPIGGRASSLHRTDSEERAISRTRLVQCASNSDLEADFERDRGRSRGAAVSRPPLPGATPAKTTPAAPALTHTSPSPPASPRLTSSLVTMEEPYDPAPASSSAFYQRLSSRSPSVSPALTPTDDGNGSDITTSAASSAAPAIGEIDSTDRAASSPSSELLLSTSPMKTPLATDRARYKASRTPSDTRSAQLSPASALLTPSSRSPPSSTTSSPGYFDWRPSSGNGTPKVQRQSSGSRGRGSARPACGYDSPGSAYESGSEFDLLGG